MLTLGPVSCYGYVHPLLGLGSTDMGGQMHNSNRSVSAEGKLTGTNVLTPEDAGKIYI